jgi:hypothetical protein
MFKAASTGITPSATMRSAVAHVAQGFSPAEAKGSLGKKTFVFIAY